MLLEDKALRRSRTVVFDRFLCMRELREEGRY